MVWDIDFCYPKSHCLFHNISTKVQSQDLTTKESKFEESKSKKLKPANKKFSTLPCNNKPAKQPTKIKKKIS